MADYKDYIVRYDIQADVTKAAEGLQSIANIAKEFEVPMRELSAAIKQVSQSAFQLKQNANISFAPKIDVGAFNNQLRNMVIQVRSAAAEMHAALFEALSGNTSATKAMQKGISTALGSPKSIKDLKSDIVAYNKELDKLLGTPVTKKGKTTRNRDGAIQMAKNAKMDDRVIELEARKKMLQKLIKQRGADLALAEQLEKETSSQQVKTDFKAKSPAKGATVLGTQPAKLTNVTPAVIKEWEKVFGDAKNKSLTVNIRGNAGGVNGALTVIQQVQASLEALQAKGTFNINPVLNMEAFAAAEAQLKRLAGLTSSVTAPFIAKDERAQGSKLGSPVTSLTKNEKTKLSEAKKQIKAWNEKISSVQSRLDANKAKYEQAPTPGLKGQITRDTKALEKYQANKSAQEDVVKSLQGKTATAVQSSIKGIKPLSIDIIGNLKGVNVTGKTPIVPIIGKLAKIQGKITETIPVNVKIMADQVAASIKSIPTPTLNVNVRLNTEGIAQQLQTVTAKPKSVTKPETKTETAPVKGIGAKSKAQFPKNTALITGDIDTKNIINQIKNIPRQTIPIAIKLMWEKGAVGRQEQLKNLATKIPPVTITLDTKAAIAKFEEFIALIKSNSIQNIQLIASGNVTNAAASASASSTSGSNNAIVKNKSLTAQDRYAKLKENAVKNAEKAKAGGKQMVLKGQEVRVKEQAWRAQQQAMYNRLFEAVPKPDYGWLQRQETQRASELLKMREDATAAFAKQTPFERKEATAHKETVSNSIARHQQKAEKLRAQAYNSMLPFAQNKEQANMMTKHRKYFKQAVITTGITPTRGMDAPQMLKYLQGVSSQMQSSSVAVPWQLQNQINKLEGQVAKSKGIASSSPTHRTPVTPVNSQKTFFDQSRKWAYPFTGQTSFGARTPMAVDMAKGMGVMFAIGGAMSAIGSSFSQAMEYQNTMRTTEAILQHGTDSYSKSSFKNMENTVREVGVKTKFSAPEVADAARFLAMAGYDINAINASIRPIADLALIGDSDLGETADKMTNIMTTFQIAPEKMREAANIMATTATRSNTDLMMLAESAKYGGGVANMYGRNDPNLFADTMALFGVMGNAGVQASSAGTALRMMYQNIFKPNKNQKAVLAMMKKDYGITTTKEDGGYRSMSDILIDMAQRIPENKMAEIVGNLFRITAQPGATATLLAAAGGDTNAAQEIGTGIDAMSNKMSSKAGLSSLVALMLANRTSMSGNISGAIAEEKQNTIQGLWAQVTSTFTEGIVKAFEQRQGGFEDILRQLRDYFAKPETIRMMQNLIDMIVEIGKVMAWFAKIWAGLYNMAPDMIKYWVTIQMFFTQIGTLISPVIQLISVFNRLGGVITKLTGISIVGAGAITTRNLAGNIIAGTVANTAPFVPMPGASNQFTGKIGSKVNSAMAANAVLAGQLALSGASKPHILQTLNQETAQHYRAVQERYYRRYGWARAKGAFSAAATAVPTMMSFTPMINGIKSMLVGLLATLAKAVGFLVNPITIVVGSLVGAGFAINRLFKTVNGNTQAQIEQQQKLSELSAKSMQAAITNAKWYQEQLDKMKNPAIPVAPDIKTEVEKKYEENKKKRQEEAQYLQEKLTKNPSDKATYKLMDDVRKMVDTNPLQRLALGDRYNELLGENWSDGIKSKQIVMPSTIGAVSLMDVMADQKLKAAKAQENLVQVEIIRAASNDPRLQEFHKQLLELRNKYSGDEFERRGRALRDSLVAPQSPGLLSASGMTVDSFWANIGELEKYKEFQQGVYNIMTGMIDGAFGTIIGQMNANENIKNGIEYFTQPFYDNLRHIIGNQPVDFEAESADKKQQKVIKLFPRLLPDGRVDANNIYTQIEESVGAFDRNLTVYAKIMAAIYRALANAGKLPDTPEAARKWVDFQTAGHPLSDSDILRYNLNNPQQSDSKTNSGNKAYLGGPIKQFVLPDDSVGIFDWTKAIKSFEPQDKNRHIRDNINKIATSEVVNGTDETKRKLEELQKPSSANAAPTNPTSTPSPVSQNEYASKYKSASARPTQINIHINELAHFDRTTVASSAEERDLVESMESKIAEAVYRIFAEASNHAQSTIDLT